MKLMIDNLEKNYKTEQLLKKAKSLRQPIPFKALKGQSLQRFKPRLMFKPYINVPRKMEKPSDAFGTFRGFMFSRGRSAVSFTWPPHIGVCGICISELKVIIHGKKCFLRIISHR